MSNKNLKSLLDAESIVATVRESLLLLDSDMKVVSANSSFYKTFKVTPKETEGKILYNIGNGQWDITELRRLLEDILPNSSVFNDFEVSHDFPQIGKKVMLLNARQLTQRANTKPMILLAIEDVTEHKKNEEALKESERLYRTLFENTEDGFLIIKPVYDQAGCPYDWVFLRVNKEFEHQTGLKASDVVSKGIREILPDFEQYWLSAYENVIKSGKSERLENYNKSTDRWYDAYIFSYGNGQVGVLFRDITIQKNLEKRLKDAEYLAAIGATAGMVGHDMRNPLQAITGAIYLMKDDTAKLPESAEKKDLEEIMETVENCITYVKKIVSDLQDYTRPIQPTFKKTNLRSLLEGILSDLKVPKGIEPLIEVDEDFTFLVDPDLMKRVFTNLILNAIQAMPKGGSLTIKTNMNGDDALITFTDTGVGIPENVKPKLFTPLFTTKSKGQGFGLVVCKRIVETQGGEITYDSEVGRGTTFTIRIPAEKESATKHA